MITSVDPALALTIRREESLTSIIRREIERMIDERELNPGDWVNEAMLASRLKVSRGPVREACRGLEQNGLLQVVVNRGVFVRKIELKDAAELMISAQRSSHSPGECSRPRLRGPRLRFCAN